MKRVLLRYGLISGLITAFLMSVTVPFQHKIRFDVALLVGYTTMVLAFLLVFFGVRSYRETEGAGKITFLRALAVGALISLVTCIFYVTTWEIIFFQFMPDFMDKYAARQEQQIRAAGASPAVVQARIDAIEKSRVMYKNVFYNAAVTFLEPMPVGLAMTLLSAVILRKKEKPRTVEAPATSN